MKGVKYNLSFKLPTGDLIESKSVDMNKLCQVIASNFKTYYYLDEIKVSNQIIYNLIKRPLGCSKLIRSKCDVSIC